MDTLRSIESFVRTGNRYAEQSVALLNFLSASLILLRVEHLLSGNDNQIVEKLDKNEKLFPELKILTYSNLAHCFNW
jgi:hypothetical protein